MASNIMSNISFLNLTVVLVLPTKLKFSSFVNKHSVHWSINRPRKSPPLSCQAPLKSANCPREPQRTRKILKLFTVNRILSFKVN